MKDKPEHQKIMFDKIDQRQYIATATTGIDSKSYPFFMSGDNFYYVTRYKLKFRKDT